MFVAVEMEDRVPATPKYRQIADDIAAQIESGQLHHGDRLPSISELQRRYGVSSQPVRMALLILQERGCIQGQQGIAVFVA